MDEVFINSVLISFNSAPQTKKVTVTGTVSDKNGIKSVVVNSLNAVVSSTGFSCANVVLNSGQNTITVVASDKAGNSAAKSISVVYQPAGAVSEEIIYTYDENGNLIKQQKGTEVINLTYDARNQLKTYVSPTQSLAYNYDGEGKRISAKAGTVTTSYLYDGMSVIIERQANKTISSYVRNPFAAGGIGGIISSTVASQPSYYLYDGLGSVANLTNSSGAVTQSYTYDGFGNTIAKSGSSSNTRQFLTKELDQSGLVYFGSRYYYPRIGRFISPDPSGMSDGPNLYLYCLNDPINAVDLWGLCKKLWWERLEDGEYYGTGFGQTAAEWYAQQQLQSGNPLWAIPGSIASLWAPKTYQWTGVILTGAYGLKSAGAVWYLRDGSSARTIIDLGNIFRLEKHMIGKGTVRVIKWHIDALGKLIRHWPWKI